MKNIRQNVLDRMTSMRYFKKKENTSFKPKQTISMGQKETVEQEVLENQKSDELNAAVGFLFSKDFWDRAILEPDLFDEAFVDRKIEIVMFEELHRQLFLGKSVVVIGRIGSGKSALLHKIKNRLSKGNLFPHGLNNIESIFLDLDEKNPQNSAELINISVELMTELLNKLNLDFHLPDPQVPPMTALHKLAEYLRYLWREKREAVPHIFFFVDDLDYKTDLWYDLVMGLRCIFSLPFITPIYAARPHLASMMFGAPDNRIKRMMMDAERIILSTLPVQEIVGSRLKQLAEGPKKSFWKRIIDSLVKYDQDLITLLERVGFRRGNNFRYPFVPKLEQFLEKTTNGNGRLIIAMVKKCLQYILDNRFTFRSNANGKYHFERPLIMEMFSDFNESGESSDFLKYPSTPIVNLNNPNFLSYDNKFPEKTGNPLLLNILEWIHHCEGNERKVVDCFAKLGHTPEDIQKGLTECFALELIEPHLIRASAEVEELQIQDYSLTPKGLFHLTHLSTWTEYTSKYDHFKGRINRSYYTKLSPQLSMYTDVIEFLQYIVTAVRDISATAREISLSLTDLITYYLKYQTTYLTRQEQDVYSPDNPDSDFMIDEPKLHSLFSNPPVTSKISSKRVYIGKYVAHPDRKPHPWRLKLSISNILSIARALKIASSSQMDIRERCDFQYFEGIASKIDYK